MQLKTLTIFVETKNENGELKNIYLKDNLSNDRSNYLRKKR